ncbi:hypothetical protein SARC_03267 [Sphaeroforma arctica JP610]|uniref:Uncharacterized protein n=1 Tax=Sphaeroforma arctica JP610 TaxID=667725 RepID=A0A0L0G6L2_9EUKA|nr:hypothetical protein SARC_03267 [Sphaeroforma arctica JP610]KNC84521.1 hypothetical protein SARC_03267 [Sphaeroforma arctica JP610]|eukprot:XP_014158423.1 hypothetical protein SARC_03267 [Sphaeroforma arctica JP610]
MQDSSRHDPFRANRRWRSTIRGGGDRNPPPIGECPGSSEISVSQPDLIMGLEALALQFFLTAIEPTDADENGPGTPALRFMDLRHTATAPTGVADIEDIIVVRKKDRTERSTIGMFQGRSTSLVTTCRAAATMEPMTGCKFAAKKALHILQRSHLPVIMYTDRKPLLDIVRLAGKYTENDNMESRRILLSIHIMHEVEIDYRRCSTSCDWPGNIPKTTLWKVAEFSAPYTLCMKWRSTIGMFQGRSTSLVTTCRVAATMEPMTGCKCAAKKALHILQRSHLPVIMYTDRKPLLDIVLLDGKYTENDIMESRRILRSIHVMHEVEIDYRYFPGPLNIFGDYMLRCCDHGTLNAPGREAGGMNIGSGAPRAPGTGSDHYLGFGPLQLAAQSARCYVRFWDTAPWLPSLFGTLANRPIIITNKEDTFLLKRKRAVGLPPWKCTLLVHAKSAEALADNDNVYTSVPTLTHDEAPHTDDGRPTSSDTIEPTTTLADAEGDVRFSPSEPTTNTATLDQKCAWNVPVALLRTILDTCGECIRTGLQGGRKKGLLQQPTRPATIGAEVNLDYLSVGPDGEGYNTILAAQDGFSQLALVCELITISNEDAGDSDLVASVQAPLLDHYLQALAHFEKAKRAQKKAADVDRIDCPMIGIGRQLHKSLLPEIGQVVPGMILSTKLIDHSIAFTTYAGIRVQPYRIRRNTKMSIMVKNSKVGKISATGSLDCAWSWHTLVYFNAVIQCATNAAPGEDQTQPQTGNSQTLLGRTADLNSFTSTGSPDTTLQALEEIRQHLVDVGENIPEKYQICALPYSLDDN